MGHVNLRVLTPDSPLRLKLLEYRLTAPPQNSVQIQSPLLQFGFFLSTIAGNDSSAANASPFTSKLFVGESDHSPPRKRTPCTLFPSDPFFLSSVSRPQVGSSFCYHCPSSFLSLAPCFLLSRLFWFSTPPSFRVHPLFRHQRIHYSSPSPFDERVLT